MVTIFNVSSLEAVESLSFADSFFHSFVRVHRVLTAPGAATGTKNPAVSRADMTPAFLGLYSCRKTYNEILAE